MYNADSERQVITRMAEQMERVGAQEEIPAGPVGVAADYTPYEILTIASMIEREAKTDEDRPLIARVIYNRLASTCRCRSTPRTSTTCRPRSSTLEGAITRLREVDTPWNTFTNTGLPATPIANPGRASIEAALHPAPNPSPGSAECTWPAGATSAMWLFYVLADEQGNHAFSVTPDQFEADRQAAGRRRIAVTAIERRP